MTFTYLTNVQVRGGLLFNGLVHQKNENGHNLLPMLFQTHTNSPNFWNKNKYI